MLMLLRRFITRNWFLKLFSLFLASLMWFAIRSGSNDQMNRTVPLLFRNIPQNMEITGGVDQVTLQLRGSFEVLAAFPDITASISLAGEGPGHKVIRVSAESVDTPRGVEVFGVDPDFVEFDLEPTVRKDIEIQANIVGEPATGYFVDHHTVDPQHMQVVGPASSIDTLESLPTIPIRIDGRTESLTVSVNLDVPDTRVVRLPTLAPVEVHIEIVEERAEKTYRVPLDPQLAGRWEANAEFVEVQVSGPTSQIEAFDPDGVYFTFNALNVPVDGLVIPEIVGLPPSFTFEVEPDALLVTPIE
jgi:YbbR domain-containing protein